MLNLALKPAPASLQNNPLLWRGDQLARNHEVVASRFAALDRELPGGGWPKGALIELLLQREGIGELRFALRALESLAKNGDALVLVAPPYVPYAPAFAQAGIDPARLIVIATPHEKDRWWAAEQVLRANSAGALLFWPRAVNDQRLRRLQVASQEGDGLAFLFIDNAWAAHASPSALRLQLSAIGPQLCVHIRKRRGGVSEAPLLIDVASYKRTPEASISKARAPVSFQRRVVASRPPLHFNKHYPVGKSDASVWNRALAHADEVRRVPGPDPRGAQCA